jgi:predicted dehydrogenase
MRPIGIGILSFAHGHVLTYCAQLQNFPDARLVAAWDDDLVRGAEASARFAIPFEPNLNTLLANPEIDAVIIASETNKHADLVEAACAHKKAILCQKPMATTLEDCDRIIAAVLQSGVHFQMAFQMRSDPLNQKIKEWLDRGELGKIGAIRRRHCINFLFNPNLVNSPSAWHIDKVANVGMFFDDAVHAADFFYWLLGKPKSVMAEIDNILTEIAPDDTGMAIYRWENGAMGELLNSSVTLAGENTCEVYGTDGVIIQNYNDSVSTPHAPENAHALKLFRKSTGQWEHFEHPVPKSHGERIAAVPRPFIDALKSNQSPTISASDGKVSVEMCLAAYESARTGRRILL